MAENNADDLLEESTDEPTETKKKGLSTSLLIKIAAGLGVLLIALIVSFFFLSKSADKEAENGDDTAQTESSTESESAQSENAEDNKDASLELPNTPSTDSSESQAIENTGELTPAVGMAATGAAAVTNPVTQPSTKILSELVALQQQIANLQDENQTLIKRVEQLAKENETLKSKTRQLNNSNPDAVINDDQLVNSSDIPLYYRESRSDSSQPELEPKWGDFEEYNSGS